MPSLPPRDGALVALGAVIGLLMGALFGAIVT